MAACDRPLVMAAPELNPHVAEVNTTQHVSVVLAFVSCRVKWEMYIPITCAAV